ncbi:MAG: hypothetical protein ACTS80_02045 [Candidatus Hodgkinia cicadicola]
MNETQPTGWRVNLIPLWRIDAELPPNKIDGSEGKLFTRTVANNANAMLRRWAYVDNRTP